MILICSGVYIVSLRANIYHLIGPFFPSILNYYIGKMREFKSRLSTVWNMKNMCRYWDATWWCFMSVVKKQTLSIKKLLWVLSAHKCTHNGASQLQIKMRACLLWDTHSSGVKKYDMIRYAPRPDKGSASYHISGRKVSYLCLNKGKDAGT